MQLNESLHIKISDAIQDIIDVTSKIVTGKKHTVTDATINTLIRKMDFLKEHHDFTEDLMPKYEKWKTDLKSWHASYDILPIVTKIDTYFHTLMQDQKVEINLVDGDDVPEVLMLNRLDLMKSPFFEKALEESSRLFFNKNVELIKIYIGYLQTFSLGKYKPTDFQTVLDLALFAHEAEDKALVRACENKLIRFLKEIELSQSSLINLFSDNELQKILPQFYKKLEVIYKDFCQANVKDSHQFLQVITNHASPLTLYWNPKQWKSFRSILPPKNKSFARNVSEAILKYSNAIRKRDWIDISFYKLNIFFFLNEFSRFISEDKVASLEKIIATKFPQESLKGEITIKNLSLLVQAFTKRLKILQIQNPDQAVNIVFRGFPKQYILHQAHRVRNRLFLNMVDAPNAGDYETQKTKFLSLSSHLLKLKELSPEAAKELEVLMKKNIHTRVRLKAAKKNIEAFTNKKANIESKKLFLQADSRSENWDCFFNVKFNDLGLITEIDVDSEDEVIIYTHDPERPLACLAKDTEVSQIFNFVLHHVYQSHIQEIKDILEDQHIHNRKDLILVRAGGQLIDRLTVAASILRGAWSLEQVLALIAQRDNGIEAIRGDYKSYPPADYPI